MLARPDTRPLLLALLASLLLHALFMARLPRPLLPPRLGDVVRGVPVEIEYRRHLPERSEHSRGAAVAPIIEDSTGASVADAPPPEAAPAAPSTADTPASTAAQTPRRALDLRLPRLDDVPSDAPWQDEARPGPSGTVVNPVLADRLRELRAAPRAATGVEAPAAGRAVGDRWESFYQVGDMCFRILEADPLDSLSRDQWFRVACDSP